MLVPSYYLLLTCCYDKFEERLLCTMFPCSVSKLLATRLIGRDWATYVYTFRIRQIPVIEGRCVELVQRALEHSSTQHDFGSGELCGSTDPVSGSFRREGLRCARPAVVSDSNGPVSTARTLEA